MKKNVFFIILLVAVLLVGCGGRVDDNNDEINNDKENNELVLGNDEEVSHKYEKTINEKLGIEITYPLDVFTYNDSSNESNSISFMGDINKSGETPNIFLSISISEYNLKDTEEGLKLQTFSDNIEVEEVAIGKDSISARKIKVSEGNNQGRMVYYYIFEREDDKSTYIIEVDTISDDKGNEKYIDEFKKMIGSFRFTNKEISKENTEEVTNMEMGFSFSVSKDFFQN